MKAYIYPITARLKTGLHNPYMDNFVSSLKSDINFLNYEIPSKTGIFDLFRYLWTIDILFLNWIENIPDKKGGRFQWIIFRYILLPILKYRGVKICWTLHNKLSHDKQNIKMKEKVFIELFSVSDYIITHASEGKQIINNKGFSDKLIFFHHPINERNRTQSGSKEIDMLIWGSIAPYKGIDKFLDQVSNSSVLKRFNIVIAGKVVDKEYEEIIEQKLSRNTKFINRFLSDEELENNLRKSKITLFTYNQASVLSSGALTDSIGFGNIVVGPDNGAFRDLKDENLIYTFKEVEQIPGLCEQLLSDFSKYKIDESLLSKYVIDHSWKFFAQVIIKKINN